MSDRRETWIVDRFESDLAVLERALHATLTLPRSLLPAGTCEGDVLRVAADASDDESRLTIARDAEETRRRAAAARAQLEQLRRPDTGGDVKL